MEAKKELLFLVHRIPYPPNKGDKIRSFNMLKHLGRNYRVHVGAFVDDPHDWQYKSALQSLCGELCLLALKPRQRRIASLKGLLTGQPLTLPYYESPAMQKWVDELLARRPIDAAVIFSSPMGRFLENHARADCRRIVDFVDVDSDKWIQYSRSKSWPWSWLYGREGRTLLAYERKLAAEFDASVFVSDEECALFQRLAPEVKERCVGICNGVDTDYFSPERDYPNPYNSAGPTLVFTGAMDYWANIDAVRWFAEKIFSVIRTRVPAAEFYIVGARPAANVRALAGKDGITVTGAVHDIRPYLAHATGVVAPMRIARGIQNKVLEAMAMGLPVLASPEAAEGIKAKPGVDLLVEPALAGFQNSAVALLLGDYQNMGRHARRCACTHYGWEQNLRRLDALLSTSAPTPTKMASI
ncbi:MAG TPA: TIGR03087 family PEP-CTERM/XrtA system glycosyltransferase [Gammaproteobacteria bacterium]|nr:TIGR03087 family PEP-CTERM/XrtA system glycosyltransferase [Gammaproteobacteria bacterium]